jgi:hypothetical protein
MFLSNAHYVYFHTALLYISTIKNLTPWRDSNPDLIFVSRMRRPLRDSARETFRFNLFPKNFALLKTKQFSIQLCAHELESFFQRFILVHCALDCYSTSVTRWVWGKKIAKNASKPIFSQNECITLNVKKQHPKVKNHPVG